LCRNLGDPFDGPWLSRCRGRCKIWVVDSSWIWGSVAAFARIDETVYFTANLPRNLPVKNVEGVNRLRFDRIIWPWVCGLTSFGPLCALYSFNLDINRLKVCFHIRQAKLSWHIFDLQRLSIAHVTCSNLWQVVDHRVAATYGIAYMNIVYV